MKTWNSRLDTGLLPDPSGEPAPADRRKRHGQHIFTLPVFQGRGTELDVGISSYIQASACFLIRPLAGVVSESPAAGRPWRSSAFSLACVQFGYIFAASLLLIQFIRFVNASLMAAAATAR